MSEAERYSYNWKQDIKNTGRYSFEMLEDYHKQQLEKKMPSDAEIVKKYPPDFDDTINEKRREGAKWVKKQLLNK